MKTVNFYKYLFTPVNKYLGITFFFLFTCFISKGQLRAGFTTGAAAGCAPLVVQFNDTSSGHPASWLWDLGNGTTSVLQHPSVAYFNPGTYTVKLIIRNSLGIDSITKADYITVYSSPVINFVASSLTGCFPLNTVFSDLSFPGSGSVEKWEWDFGDGTFSAIQNAHHTYTAAGNYNVSLRATNSFGCITSKTTPSYIHISSGAKAKFVTSTHNSCNAPAVINFVDSSSGNGSLRHYWDFGDGTTSVAANPSHTYNSPGNFTVSLIVTSSTGCTDTLIKRNLITIGNTNASFSGPAAICSSTPFNFNNSSTPAAGSAFWDFGDGTFSDSINPSKTYSTPGNYTIKMVADFGACKDSVSKTVQVIARPEVDFSAPSTVSCKAPFTVNFAHASVGGARYLWDFGDGKSSNDENATHTYLAEGNYKVKLVVTNAAGCKDSIVKVDFIKIKTPVVSIENLPQKGCAPLAHNFTAKVNSLDSIVTYQWNFGDGNTSDAVSPNHVYHRPGKYTISLTYTSASGCTNTVTVTDGILVGSKPQPLFSANPLNVCANQSVAFTDLSGGNPNEWAWFFGDGSSSEKQNPFHVYNDTGFFSVTLIAINNGCADTIAFPKYVHINPPIARFSFAKSCETPQHVVFTDKSIGADISSWDFGDGLTSTEKSPVHDYALPGNYTVALTVTNQATGCSFTKTQDIRIINETAGFMPGEETICKNTPVLFTATGNPENVSLYTWAFGDGVSVSGTKNSISHQYSKASAYGVTLVIKDVNGCLDSVSKPLHIQVDGPAASFRASIAGTCLNNTIDFVDSSQGDGVHDIKEWKFTWGDGSSQSFTAPPFQHAYSSGGNYTVSLRVTDSKGCTDNISKSRAVIVSKPVASFNGDTLSCTTRPVTFSSTSTGPDLTYAWDFGDGATSREQNPVHLYAKEGNYSVRLSVLDKYGCNSTVSSSNYIKIANPRAGFTLSDSISTCPPLVVNFTNTSANYSKWKWDFGDGTTSAERNPSHFYSEAGTFTAMLTVSGPGGCTSVKTKKIKVEGPAGSFSYTDLIGCAPLKTSFKAHTEKNISFVWDFNDGTTISGSDSIVTHTYTTPGSYLPKLILINASGCRVPVKGKDTIKVFGVLASFKQNDALVCDSGKVQFTNTSTGNDVILNYLWDFGDGTTSGQPDPLHAYNEPGDYTTSLAITTQRGCKGSVQGAKPLRVYRSPKITIAGDKGACVPAVFKFTGINASGARTMSPLSWKWDFGNGNESRQQDPPAQTYTAAGAFTVKAEATDVNGCNVIATKLVDIYPLPSLKTSDDDVVCVGSSASLRVNGAKSYSWSPSAYLSCADCATPVARPDSSITYRITGTSDKGCISRDSVSLAVKFPFRLSISKADTLCIGKSTQLNAGGTETYTWSPSTGLNNASIASPVASPSTSTVYKVIGSDSKGCFKDTAYIPVSVFPIPTVNAGADKTINVGQQVEIIPQISKDVTQVVWTPSIGVVSNTYPAITVKPSESIEYTIDVKNAGGCSGRDKISIFVLCNNANIFVPNTFSPNGDGSNDIFYPRGSGVFKIKNLRIFNRWGEVVFERSNFNANDASTGWDGNQKGQKLQPDVFVYTLEVVCDNNTSLVFKGNIALIK